MSAIAIETQKRREELSARSQAIRDNVQQLDTLLQHLRTNIEETHGLLEETRQLVVSTLKTGGVRKELVPVIEAVNEIAAFSVEVFSDAPTHFHDAATLSKAKAYRSEAEGILAWARHLAQEVAKPLPPAPTELQLAQLPGVPAGQAAGFVSVAEARARRSRSQ